VVVVFEGVGEDQVVVVVAAAAVTVEVLQL
jgi:hypothetical protein